MHGVKPKGKRNYPKNRKPRSNEYSTITRLLRDFSLNKIKEICTEYGIYKGSDILTDMWKAKDKKNFVNYTTIRYLRQKFGWVRLVTSIKDPNAQSVINGNVPVSHFKTIRFSQEILSRINNQRVKP